MFECIFQSQRQISQPFKDLFKTKVSSITMMGHSIDFFTRMRTAFLQLQQPIPLPTPLWTYTHKQIGQDKNKKPFEWNYSQLALSQQQLTHQQDLLFSAAILSTVIVFQFSHQRDILHFQQLMNRMTKQSIGFAYHHHIPNIFLHLTQQIQRSAHLTPSNEQQYIARILQQGCQPSVLQQGCQPSVLQQGYQSRIHCVYPYEQTNKHHLLSKKVLREGTDKSINCVRFTQSTLIKMVQNILGGGSLSNAFNTLYDPQLEVQQHITNYKSMLQQIIQKSNIVQEEVLREAHQMAKKQSLKIMGMRYVQHNNEVSITEMEMRVLFLEAVQVGLEREIKNNAVKNLQWGKQVLDQLIAGLQVENIRSIAYLKQEMSVVRELFRKKTQSVSSVQLITYMEQTLFSKLFQYFTIIMGGQMQSINSQNRIVKNNAANMEIQCRELRRKYSKEEAEWVRKEFSWKEQLNNHIYNNQQFKKSNERLRQQLSSTVVKYQNKLHEIEEERYKNQKQWENQLDKVQQQKTVNQQQITILQSQIQRERLLHKEQIIHYMSMLQEQKDKINIQKEQMKKIYDETIKSQTQIEELKQSIVKERLKQNNQLLLNQSPTSLHRPCTHSAQIQNQQQSATNNQYYQQQIQILNNKIYSLQEVISHNHRQQQINIRLNQEKNNLQQKYQIAQKQLKTLEQNLYFATMNLQQQMKKTKQLQSVQNQTLKQYKEINHRCQPLHEKCKIKLAEALKMVSALQYQYEQMMEKGLPKTRHRIR